VAKYDVIGQGYRNYRLPDPRIASLLQQALADSNTILNIGAGVGSYEPAGRQVVALEPSWIMIGQRPAGAAPVVQGAAEALPFGDDSFDAAMGVLTLHHWEDPARGLREALRVSRQRLVLLSWVGYVNHFWLFDYFPEIKTIDERIFPSLAWIEEITGCRVEAEPLLIPGDCSDGFMCAWWRRPEAYLDAGVRTAISTFAVLENVEQRLQALQQDLEDGSWKRRYGYLLQRESMDYGYRVLRLEL